MDRDELQAVMDDMRWSQSDLASKLGIKPGTVNRWIKGKARMSVAKEKELRRVLDGKPPQTNPDNEANELMRENNLLLKELLATRDAEIERLKKRISTLETESSLPTLRTANG